jgi:hypothetical protein
MWVMWTPTALLPSTAASPTAAALQGYTGARLDEPHALAGYARARGLRIAWL